jgi:hypothetical protein
MGADWLKFKIRQGADAKEVRRLAAFVNGHSVVSHAVVTPPAAWDAGIAEQRKKAHAQLNRLLEFPRDRDEADVWAFTMLTDPPGVQLGRPPGLPPRVDELEVCRVHVISHNPIFPIEWREEAYRIILPRELAAYLKKWRTYIDQVLSGQWQEYLHELYLFNRVHDPLQYQEMENLVRWADESLKSRSAWCRKEPLAAIRTHILETHVLAQLEALHAANAWPKFSGASPRKKIGKKQRAKEDDYWALFGRAAEQIREWNRFVPQNRKVNFPARVTYENFLDHAASTWLRNFFTWCRYLIDQKYGLYLWA